MEKKVIISSESGKKSALAFFETIKAKKAEALKKMEERNSPTVESLKKWLSQKASHGA